MEENRALQSNPVEIDLAPAEDLITKYNITKYGGRTNPEIDQEAIDTFARGLGASIPLVLAYPVIRVALSVPVCSPRFGSGFPWRSKFFKSKFPR
jgi:hypothetical protein